MSWPRIRAILVKEWREVLRNRGVLWTTVAVAALMVALPLVLVQVLSAADLAAAVESGKSEEMLRMMVERVSGFSELDQEERMKAFLLRQLVALFVILPVVGTMSIATYSIVGEKRSRSLEPLLACPVTTGELLLGKSIAAVVPSLAVTWAAWAVFGAAVRLGLGAALAAAVLDLTAWLTMILAVPAIAVLAVAAGILVSSRSTDPRSAQQVGTIVLLPILAVVMGQLTGLFLLGTTFVLVGTAILVLIDVALLAWGRRLFQRERILVRWR